MRRPSSFRYRIDTHQAGHSALTSYLLNREPHLAHSLTRNFLWFENTLWAEDLLGCFLQMYFKFTFNQLFIYFCIVLFMYFLYTFRILSLQLDFSIYFSRTFYLYFLQKTRMHLFRENIFFFFNEHRHQTVVLLSTAASIVGLQVQLSAELGRLGDT